MAGEHLVLYGEILQLLKQKIKTAQQKAILAVNNELLSVYWEIGKAISEQEHLAGWGGKIVDKLAADLKAEFPEMKGLSPRNLRYMRDFALAYPSFLQQAAAKSQSTKIEDNLILQQLAAKLPWGHHQVLLTKLKTIAERAFYIRKAVENGWSRSVLEHHIESNFYKAQGSLTNNFNETLPALQSELTQQIFKDPYNFDFIMLGEKAKERDLENALINHVTKVLLELGSGFAFMGRQRPFEAGGREFIIDLLFYHTKLRRHIIIELKIGEFEPEYVSKMNLYLGLADDILKDKYDEPAIGLILCKTNNKIVAEYALRDTTKPIGIAEYKIAEHLPENIKGELPSIEEIEEKMDLEIKATSNPFELKLQQLKRKIQQLNSGEAVKKSSDYIDLIYKDFLIPFYQKCYKLWEKEIIPLFTEYEQVVSIDGTGNAYHTSVDFEAQLMQGNINELMIDARFNGFKKAGTKAFDVTAGISVKFHEFNYTVSIKNNENTEIEKLYSQLPTEEEKELMEAEIHENLLDSINVKIEGVK
jgi:predicted nuclease of restriction endonuclease-like (RecB) superfamily